MTIMFPLVNRKRIIGTWDFETTLTNDRCPHKTPGYGRLKDVSVSKIDTRFYQNREGRIRHIEIKEENRTQSMLKVIL